MAKQLLIDFKEYKDELNKEYAEGYKTAIKSLAVELINNIPESKEMILGALKEFCISEEIYEVYDSIITLTDL